MADITKTVGIIFEGTDSASAAINSVNTSLKSVGESATAANPKFDEMAAKWENGQVKAQLLAKQAKDAALALDQTGKSAKDAGTTAEFLSVQMQRLATALVLKDFIEANVEQEKFIKIMTAVTGSVEGARREFEFVNAVANKLGIEAEGAAAGYAKFAAAAKGSALEGEGARIIFEAFSGALARVGATSAEISGAFVQLSQGVSKGKFELEDLKSIADRFPAFFPEFAKSLGITTEELFKFVSQGKITGEQILIFAKQLQEGFDPTQFDGFIGSLARLKNAKDDAFRQIGDAGAFDALTKGAQVATAAIVGTIATVELIGKIWGAFALAVQTGDFKSFGENFGAAVEAAADKTRGARDAMLGLNDAVKTTGDTTKAAGASLQDYSNEGRNSLLALRASTAEVDAALKTLGVDPKKFKNDIGEILAAFANLANNPDAKGDQILAGFLATLKSIKDNDAINQIGGDLTAAFLAGKISSVDFSTAIVALGKKQEELNKAFGITTESSKVQTDAIKKQADETKRAEENAAKMALELEKLASNERIKLIEARVQLNVAQVENDTKRILAAFDSINNTINSTADVIGSIFDAFKGINNLDSSARNALFNQLDIENNLRQAAFDLQKKLTEAQIEALQAQTRKIEAGDALIKVDGSGLQPHLEAFMWEILKAIQVRVNQDGLAMLLGV